MKDLIARMRYLFSKLLHHLHEPSRMVMSQAWIAKHREQS